VFSESKKINLVIFFYNP